MDYHYWWRCRLSLQKCAIHVRKCHFVINFVPSPPPAAKETKEMGNWLHRAVVRRDDRNTDTPNDSPDKTGGFFSVPCHSYSLAEWKSVASTRAHNDSIKMAKWNMTRSRLLLIYLRTVCSELTMPQQICIRPTYWRASLDSSWANNCCCAYGMNSRNRHHCVQNQHFICCITLFGFRIYSDCDDDNRI